MAMAAATPPVADMLTPNPRFAKLASDAAVERTAKALTANGMTAIVVDTGEQAKAEALKLIPQGTQVYTSASQTVETIGLGAELNESGRYNSVRQTIYTMDRAKEAAEIRRMVSSHDIVVGSVHAITEAGSALIASRGGSQLPAYAAGAGKVIWIVGTQ